MAGCGAHEDSQTVRLGGELGLAEACELWSRGRAAIHVGACVLDLSDAKRAGGPAVQAIVALGRVAPSPQALRLRISEPVRQACGRFGVGLEIMQWEEEPR